MSDTQHWFARLREVDGARSRGLAWLGVTFLAACGSGDLPLVEGRVVELVASTIPDATCRMHVQGVEDRELKLVSNAEGQVRFHVRRLAQDVSPEVIQLDCQNKLGQREQSQHYLETLLNEAQAGARIAPNSARIRPPLADPERVTARELELGGYPPRPNADQESSVYQAWLDDVTTLTRIVAFDGPVSELAFADFTSSNWCGTVATSGPYDYAFGAWTEPHVSAMSEGSQLISGAWVGIGGAANDTLIQAGTRQDVFSLGGMEYATHQVFRQVFPHTDPYFCSNCTLSEGDQLEFSAQIRDLNSNGGGTGLLYYRNVTQNESATVEVPFANGFTGGSAEWIMEDPRAQGNLLPDFGTLTFTDMYTYSAATGEQNFGASNFDTYALNVNGHDYCTTRVRSDTSIDVTRQPD